jgi:hypothetical protein
MTLSETIILDSSNQVHMQGAPGVRNDAANWATLCPELIHEILTHCLWGVALFAGDPELFPWYLGHICQLWRSVFISSPCFWDRFTAENLCSKERASTSRFKRALALVELCIERTKDHPFSFKFAGVTFTMNEATNTPTIQSQYSIQILETLVTHAGRWRTACLSADGDGLTKSLTKAKHRFGQLHSLQIRTLWERHDMPSDLFQDASNLTRVHATDFYQLRWSSITVLHINSRRHGTTDKFFAKLDKMTCLEELEIKGLPLRDYTGPLIELSSLKIFSADHCFLVSLIKAPALEILYLTGPLAGGVPNATTLLRGVNRFQTLSFDVHKSGYARIIDCTPELDHLILSPDYTSELVSDLRSVLQSLPSHSTARSLRRITISKLRPIVSNIDELLTVIKSWEKCEFPKLRSVSVHVNDSREEDITSAVALFMRTGASDRGFEIDVSFTPFVPVLAFGEFERNLECTVR